jgi:hypothetical protein
MPKKILHQGLQIQLLEIERLFSMYNSIFSLEFSSAKLSTKVLIAIDRTMSRSFISAFFI